MQWQSQLLTHTHTHSKGMHSVATAAGVRCLSLLFGWRMSEWTRVAECPSWFMRLTAPQSHHLRTRISISISLLVFPTPREPSYQLISSLCNSPRKWVKSRSDSLIWHFLEPPSPSLSGSWFSVLIFASLSLFPAVSAFVGEHGWQSAFCFGIFFHICLTRLCVLNCHFSWQFNLDYAEATEHQLVAAGSAGRIKGGGEKDWFTDWTAIA